MPKLPKNVSLPCFMPLYYKSSLASDFYFPSKIFRRNLYVKRLEKAPKYWLISQEIFIFVSSMTVHRNFQPILVQNSYAIFIENYNKCSFKQKYNLLFFRFCAGNIIKYDFHNRDGREK